MQIENSSAIDRNISGIIPIKHTNEDNKRKISQPIIMMVVESFIKLFTSTITLS